MSLIGMSLVEVRDLAKKTAEAKGHEIRRWNKKTHWYTAICTKCRATLKVYRRAEDEPPSRPDLIQGDGFIIARDSRNYWTGLDFNRAEGSALQERCSIRASR